MRKKIIFLSGIGCLLLVGLLIYFFHEPQYASTFVGDIISTEQTSDQITSLTLLLKQPVEQDDRVILSVPTDNYVQFKQQLQRDQTHQIQYRGNSKVGTVSPVTIPGRIIAVSEPE